MASCTSDPRTRAAPKPAPISTPFIAWMHMSAWARRPSSFRSHCTWLPRPGITLTATTSNTPPSVSPACAASRIASFIRASAEESAHARSLARERARSSPAGTPARSPHSAGPIATTWAKTSTPTAASSLRETDPTAVREAVSLALARSRMSRRSYRSCFSPPARSAWPGRGRVSASGVDGRGAGDIRSSQLPWSRLVIDIAMGEPRVSPPRTPPTNSTRSVSIFIRPPRP
jgi:hypothetical protein